MASGNWLGQDGTPALTGLTVDWGGFAPAGEHSVSSFQVFDGGGLGLVGVANLWRRGSSSLEMRVLLRSDDGLRWRRIGEIWA